MELVNELYIRNKLPLEEMLTGLAEEAAELAQAALKYRRAITGDNPTPITQEDARKNLLEEIADVNLYTALILPKNCTAGGMEFYYMMECANNKEHRWVERLKEASNGADR